jgi:hypothetical protein
MFVISNTKTEVGWQYQLREVDARLQASALGGALWRDERIRE